MGLLLKSDVLPRRTFPVAPTPKGVQGTFYSVGVQPEILLAISIVQGAFERCGVRDCMITSLLDGTHMEGSLHYKGLAADFRTKGTGLSQRLYEEVRKALPLNLYDVLLESKDQDNEHLHLEFQPK